MNLGINGKTAIVCAASKGLGRACAMALAGEGVNVVINGRDPRLAGGDRGRRPRFGTRRHRHYGSWQRY